MRRLRMLGGAVCAMAVLSFAQPRSAWAEDINASQYGNSTGSMPYAVAMAKGFFTQVGANITGIIGTNGGGADVRNLVAGDLPYADSGLSSVITAIQQGADLVIVSGNAMNGASLVWVTRNDSPIKTVHDLKGMRMGFSTPQSTSQAMEFWLLDAAGYKKNDVILSSTSGFGPGLTALANGGVDITVIPLPNLLQDPGRFRPVIWGRDALPPMSNTVGVVTRKAAHERPELIRAIIAGRRKAVEYMRSNREESAEIIGKAYKLDTKVTLAVLNKLIDEGDVQGVPYWGLGNFDYPGMENMIRASRLNGMITGDVNLKKIVDESFLPSDLRSKP